MTQKNKKRQWSRHSCLFTSCTTGNASQTSYKGFPDLMLNKNYNLYPSLASIQIYPTPRSHYTKQSKVLQVFHFCSWHNSTIPINRKCRCAKETVYTLIITAQISIITTELLLLCFHYTVETI